MDKIKQQVALTLVGVLAILAAGWFLVISPKRNDAADVRLQAEQQVSANASLETRISMLKAQAKQLPQEQAKIAAVAAKIPDNPALPALIRSLTKAADEAGVELVSLSPVAPVAVAAPAKAAVVAESTTSEAADATTAAVSTTPKPASGFGALQVIGLSVNVVGGYFQVEQFLDRVENLQRAMKVTGFNLAQGANPVKDSAAQPATESGKVLTATLTSSVYMATGRTAVAATAGK